MITFRNVNDENDGLRVSFLCNVIMLRYKWWDKSTYYNIYKYKLWFWENEQYNIAVSSIYINSDKFLRCICGNIHYFYIYYSNP